MQLRKTGTREFLKTANSARPSDSILQFLKTHSCLFIRNCTRNYTITYTNKLATGVTYFEVITQYTRKNAQVATDLQTSCNKSVTSC